MTFKALCIYTMLHEEAECTVNCQISRMTGIKKENTGLCGLDLRAGCELPWKPYTIATG